MVKNYKESLQKDSRGRGVKESSEDMFILFNIEKRI